MGWVEPGSGRVLVPPVAPGRGMAREHYRVGVPPSRLEMDQAQQLAELRALRDEVHRPGRAELRALAAEVRSDETLARLRAARDRLDRVDAWVRLWRRNAGRRTPLPQVLALSRDESFNAYTQAFTAAQSMVAAVEAVQPRLSQAELVAMRRQVHAAARPGRLSSFGVAVPGRSTASAGGDAPSPGAAHGSGARAAYAARAREAEYRRLVGLIYEADRAVADSRGTPLQRGHLVRAARLRGLAASARAG